MSKKTSVFGKLSSKIVATVLCAAMVSSGIAVNASTLDNMYTFQSLISNSGETKWLTSAKKEYTNITVTCASSTAHSIMELWKNSIFGDVHYDQNQMITVGTGRRVWWYGDTENSSNYHINAIVADNYGNFVSYTGYFQNFT